MKNRILIIICCLIFILQSCYTIDESMFFQPTKLERLSNAYDFNDIYFLYEGPASLFKHRISKLEIMEHDIAIRSREVQHIEVSTMLVTLVLCQS